MNIYTINPDVSFVDELAKGVLSRFGYNPLELSKVTIMLPNLRSIRFLRQAFLRQTQGRALLLPSMRAIGDYDELNLQFLGDSELITDISPAISPLKRRMILADLIMEVDKKANPDNPAINIEHAHYLAYDLAQFLDDVQCYDLSFNKLSEIVPEELSEHWQITLDFFELLSKIWPEKLKSMSMLDPWQRKAILADAQVKTWQNNPVSAPIIIAGTTGSIPSTSLIIKELLKHKDGYLVLPSIDKELDASSWEGLEEHHPQYGMKELLEQLHYNRKDVELWNDCHIAEFSRVNLLREVMRPAKTIEQWQKSTINISSTQGLERIDLANLQDEAKVISLMLRCQLEKQGKTGALITNDRELARRVAIIMRRWQVEIDDSAGSLLFDTPSALFMRLIVQVVESKFAPVELLAFLKHPFASFGLDPAEANNIVRKLDEKVLRGVRGNDGFDGFREIINSNDKLYTNEKKELISFINLIEEKLNIFCQLMSQKKSPINKILQAHIACAENIAATTLKNGDERLWLGEQGEQVASFLSQLLDASVDSNLLETNQYGGLFNSLWIGQKIRKSYNRHPRLSILSPIEARFQHFDLVILGGLNQNSWPSTANNAWMSKSMRQDFGLPSSARMIGLSAHDFNIHACAKKVVLTRCDKIAGSPTVPCQWLLRMEAVIKSQNWDEDVLNPEQPWQEWAELLSQPDNYNPIKYPQPKPEISARPTQMSVTNIEKWLRDPYSIYAKYILDLRKLDDIDQDPGAAEFGNLVHKALENYVNKYSGYSFEQELENLLECGRGVFAQFIHRPAVARVWWPRFEAMSLWFVSNEIARRKDIKHIATETKGVWKLPSDKVDFTIFATADRIEINNDGQLNIIDYKTGVSPSKKDVETGISPQLTIEALIAESVGFDKLKGNVANLEYWKISANEDKPTIISLEDSHLLDETQKWLTEMIEIFNQQQTPYLSCPNKELAPRYNDYIHLARTKEWSNY